MRVKGFVNEIIEDVGDLDIEDRNRFLKDVVIELVGRVITDKRITEIQKDWESMYESIKPESEVICLDIINDLNIGISRTEMKRLFEQNSVRLRIGKRSWIVKQNYEKKENTKKVKRDC